MDVQQVLLIVAVVAFAAAAVFFGLAIRTFVSQNIRGVLNDLSGRTRQRGVSASIGGGRGRRGSARARKGVATSGQDSSPAASSSAVWQEDAIGTRINTLLSQTPVTGMAPMGEGDVTPTMVVHATDMPDVSSPPDDPTPSVEGVEQKAPVSFTVVRRIVCLHSEGVITAA